MSNNKDNIFEHENLDAPIIRKGIYELGKVNRVPPTVGIFDEPTRCFKINLEWWSHVAGMVHLLADVVSWQEAEDDDYYAIKEILKFMQGMDCMDCGDVADCVESELITNIELQNAITNYVNNAGFGNPNHVNPTQTTVIDRNPAGALEQDVLTLDECNLDKLWAGIREGIVFRLDDLCRDLLQDLAVIGDTAERLTVFIDVIPVIGDIAEGLAFQLTEVIPDLLDLYDSFSNASEMDTIACGIFDLVCAECRYPTYDEIFNYYNSRGAAGVILASTNLEDVAQLVLDAVSGSSELAYFTLQMWQLWVLFVGATFNGESGTSAIVKFATLGEDSANDNWLQLCDACGETYMLYVWDFTAQGQTQSYVTGGYSGGQLGQFVAGSGWRLQPTDATSALASIGLLLNPAWKMHAVAFKTSHQLPTFTAQMRPTPASQTGAAGINMSNTTATWNNYANGLAGMTSKKEFAIRAVDTIANDCYIEKMAIIFDAGFAPQGARPTASADISNQS